MASITGLLIFNVNRSGLIDFANDSGVANIPIVLQSTDGDLRTIATFTDDSGEYKFSNVPPGNYRVVVADGYSKTILPIPTDFDANARASSQIQVAKVPSYTSIAPENRVDGMNALNTVTSTTVNLTVTPTVDVYEADFLIGPAIYLTQTLENCLIVYPDNLIKVASNGTFGEVSQGSSPDSGPSNNPYPNDNITSCFKFTKQTNELFRGYYTIGNTISPYSDDYNWWRLSDHSTSTETGLMQIVGGDGSNNASFSTIVNNLNENTTYLFSFWIANIDKSPNQINSKVSVCIKGLNDCCTLYSDYEQISTNSHLPIWQQVSIKFNTCCNSCISICICSPVSMYYAVDDISLNRLSIASCSCMAKCALSIASCADRYTTCIGDIIRFSVAISNNTNTIIGNSSRVFLYNNLSKSASFILGSLIINNVQLPYYFDIYCIDLGVFSPCEVKTICFDAVVNNCFINPIYNISQIVYRYNTQVSDNYTYCSDRSDVAVYIC